MSLSLWLVCGVVVAVAAWRLRLAAARLRAILGEPPEAQRAEVAPASGEPPAIAWPHPPGRLWVR
ncbi:hypothetical protein [Actinokineospora fastidiosa]|uniref:Uncharacterized protein n=1 Tax=Actinokineospora fastidiosa TaxID=1816 RepID=A0A918GRZ8_9PSEU|nr:hypothetical protein [Actinokineospora fastidiosa]GGS57093.1 hypothetical protein GCM10010171_60040 [Actinokineospora fastidiosa]